MAVGILGAMGSITANGQHLFVGELSLDGAIRPVRGALSVAVCARAQGIPNLVLPFDNAAEAAVVEGVQVYGVRHLAEVVALLERPAEFSPALPRAANGVLAAASGPGPGRTETAGETINRIIQDARLRTTVATSKP